MDTKWFIRVGCAVAANAIMLGIVAAIFDRVEINAVTFIIAVAIFTAAAVLIKPTADRLAGRYASGVTWVAGLATVYLALLITDILSGGLEIEGVGTWIAATVLVWLGTLAYDLVDDKVIAAVGQHVPGSAGRSPA